MDTNMHVRDGVFDKYNQGYAPRSHMVDSSSSLVHAPASLHDFEEGKSEPQNPKYITC